jgi:GDP-mannose transporter
MWCVLLLGLGFRKSIGPEAWMPPAVAALAASCICGSAMSYSGFRLRSLVSATTFTVVGIMCKVATVIINLVIWDRHEAPAGLAALALCLAAGSAYEQAPMRAQPMPIKHKT